MKIKRNLWKDIYFRKKFYCFESNSRSFHILCRMNLLTYLELLNNLSKVKAFRFKTKIKNRCFLSGRKRGLLTKRVHLSRIKFKDLSNNGNLLGYKKYSF